MLHLRLYTGVFLTLSEDVRRQFHTEDVTYLLRNASVKRQIHKCLQKVIVLVLYYHSGLK